MQDGPHGTMERIDKLIEEDQYEQALPLLDTLIMRRELESESLFKKAECLQRLERYKESIEFYDKALEIDEEDDMAWNGKGYSLFQLGEYGKAKLCFDVASDLVPENLEYRLSMAEMCILLEEYDEGWEISKDVLKDAKESIDIIVSWSFSLLALFLNTYIIEALTTLDELIGYIKIIETDPIPENDFRGADYDFSGISSIIKGRLKDASLDLMMDLVMYLKGEIGFEEFETKKREHYQNIKETDLVDARKIVKKKFKKELVPEEPDWNVITNPVVKESMLWLDDLVKGIFDGQGIGTFASLFEIYDWNLDRGPAPFIQELINPFFVDIGDKYVLRLAIDLDFLVNALGGEWDEAIQKISKKIKLPDLEELYIQSTRLLPIISLMRAIPPRRNPELSLIIKLASPGNLNDFSILEKIEEAWEIDLIPVDYQEEEKIRVLSMVWKQKKG
ncbi:MAG: tetratricopeptide repeat protein [Candidatus Hodarchaeota archaeon]